MRVKPQTPAGPRGKVSEVTGRGRGRSGWEAEGRGWSGKGRLGPAAREQARPQWQGHRVKRRPDRGVSRLPQTRGSRQCLSTGGRGGRRAGGGRQGDGFPRGRTTHLEGGTHRLGGWEGLHLGLEGREVPGEFGDRWGDRGGDALGRGRGK